MPQQAAKQTPSSPFIFPSTWHPHWGADAGVAWTPREREGIPDGIRALDENQSEMGAVMYPIALEGCGSLAGSVL